MLTLSARGTSLRAVSICTNRAVRAVRQVTCPVSQATGLRGHPNLAKRRAWHSVSVLGLNKTSTVDKHNLFWSVTRDTPWQGKAKQPLRFLHWRLQHGVQCVRPGSRKTEAFAPPLSVYLSRMICD